MTLTVPWPYDSTTTVTLRPCSYCGMWHTGICDKVKSIEYYPNGRIKRVEFHEEMTQLEIEPAGYVRSEDGNYFSLDS